MAATSLTAGCRRCRVLTRLAGFLKKKKCNKEVLIRRPRFPRQHRLLDSTHVAALPAT